MNSPFGNQNPNQYHPQPQIRGPQPVNNESFATRPSFYSSSVTPDIGHSLHPSPDQTAAPYDGSLQNLKANRDVIDEIYNRATSKRRFRRIMPRRRFR